MDGRLLADGSEPQPKRAGVPAGAGGRAAPGGHVRNAGGTGLPEPGGRLLLDALPGPAAVINRDSVVTAVNGQWRDMAAANGGSARSGVGANYLAVCDAAADAADGAAAGQDADAQDAVAAAARIRGVLDGGGAAAPLDYPCHSPARRRWYSLLVGPLPVHLGGALVLHLDVTDRVLAPERLAYTTLRDPLTGLPNRLLLQDRLEQAVRRHRCDPDLHLAVVLADLDGFEVCEDRLGHRAQDLVLREAATRLATTLRSGDTLGRWSGGQFVAVVADLASPDDVSHLTARLAAAVRPPVTVRLDGSDHDVEVGVTLGVALLQPGQSAVSLLASAEQALWAGRRLRVPSAGAAARHAGAHRR